MKNKIYLSIYRLQDQSDSINFAIKKRYADERNHV